MTQVYRITKNGKIRKIENQEYFDGFNWQNFEYGDIVWLEDHPNKTLSSKAFGMFIGLTKNNNPVIYVETQNTWPAHLARREVHIADREASHKDALLESIKDVNYKNKGNYSWETAITWGQHLLTKKETVENSSL